MRFSIQRSVLSQKKHRNSRNISHSISLNTSHIWRRYFALATSAAALAAAGSAVQATTITGIGLSGLPAGLNGAGVNVAQVEANFATPPSSGTQTIDQFEANPAGISINNSAIGITYIDFNGHQSSTTGASYTSGSYTYNDIESGHADSVGGYFYGSSGVASGVAHVDNYDAGYFENSVVGTLSTTSLAPPPTLNNDKVVNQSFINKFPPTTTAAQAQSEQTLIDGEYDNYTNTYGTIFVSAVGDGSAEVGTHSQINPPATAYNSIAVGAYPYTTTSSGIGPTSDGRSAPDIVAPGSATSYTTPLVSGAAAIMVQAGTLAAGYSSGDGFTNQAAYSTAATDERTVKALLLNGAVKPGGWTNSYSINSGTYTYNPISTTTTTPLDPRYGSGILNVDNTYNNLIAGRVVASSVNNSTAALTSSTITHNEGWDYSSITSGLTANNVAHYVFNLSAASQRYNLTSTLVWNAQTQASLVRTVGGTQKPSFSETLNQLDLNIYNSAGTLVASSASTVDNLQQLYVLGLTPGSYDLQVVDLGGAATWASPTDPYALAFNFQPVPEPAALLILLCGLSALALRRRNRVALQMNTD